MFRQLCLLVLAASIFPCTLLKGQDVTANYLPDTSAGSVYNELIALWGDYIRSQPDSLYDNPFWSEEEKSAMKHFDFLARYFSPSTYMGFSSRVLSISYDPALDYYTIKSMFSYCREDGAPYVLCIVNYHPRRRWL